MIGCLRHSIDDVSTGPRLLRRLVLSWDEPRSSYSMFDAIINTQDVAHSQMRFTVCCEVFVL